MNLTSPKHKRRNVPITTTLDLAHLSFGSPESRVIARQVLREANGLSPLSQDEQDCLQLYSGAFFLETSLMTPDYSDLEKTAAYRRGKEIRHRLFGPDVPHHLGPKGERATYASINFEAAYCREPRAADILRVQDLERVAVSLRQELERFIEAWERQLPEMHCPLRVDGVRIFQRQSTKFGASVCHCLPAGEGFHWSEATNFSVENEWRDVEREAFEAYPKEHKVLGPGSMPHCAAVVFLGVIDGKHRCKPLDDNLNDAVTPEN